MATELKFDEYFKATDYIKEKYGEKLTPTKFLNLLLKTNIKILRTATENRLLTEEEKEVFKIVPTHKDNCDIYVKGERVLKNKFVNISIDITNYYKEFINKNIKSACISLRASMVNHKVIYTRKISISEKEYKEIKGNKNTISMMFFYYYPQLDSMPSCELLQGLKDKTITDKQFINLCKSCEL